jgi:predicted AlkP superfamily phosphohydrolase/phosphomutase
MDLAVVGIDALDPDLVEEWQADLPTLNRLIGAGSESRLRSTDPPLTCPAWPTLYTGKQGGKHGVFGFTTQTEGGYERRPVDYRDIQAESLWKILDREGISCGVANVPLTYPPNELDDGFVLSGWPVPNNAEVSSPGSVVETIEAELGDSYRVNPFPLTFEFDEMENRELFERIREGLWHHHDAFEVLVEQHSLDVFFFVYMAVDVASHNFAWDRKLLREVYIEQDRALGHLIEKLPDETDLIVLSDHGHGARGERSFHINEWLEREGYLATTDDSEQQSLLQRIGITQANYVRLKNALGVGDVHKRIPQPVYERLRTVVPRDESSHDSGFDADTIDWRNTAAYSGAQNTVCLNTVGEDPQGSVEAGEADQLRKNLAEELIEITHPAADHNGPLMSRVETKDALFEGPFIDRAPDIVFIADEMRCNAPVRFSGGEIFTPAKWGEHRQYGTLVTSGPSFTSGQEVSDADIKDVLPLILSILEIPAPDNIDGSVLEDRLKSDGELDLRPSYDRGQRDEAADENVSDDVMEQLEGLGYLE